MMYKGLQQQLFLQFYHLEMTKSSKKVYHDNKFVRLYNFVALFSEFFLQIVIKSAFSSKRNSTDYLKIILSLPRFCCLNIQNKY